MNDRSADETEYDYDAALIQAVKWFTGETLPCVLDAAGQLDLALSARAGGFSLRTVKLRGAWWQHLGEPLLAFRGIDQHPVAIIATRSGVCMRDPLTQQTITLTRENAAEISAYGIAFYRAFPDRPLSLRDMLVFGWRSVSSEVVRLFIVGTAAGLISLAAPLISAGLFQVIIPQRERSQLWLLLIVLLLAAISLALFEVARGWLLLRISGRLELSLQAAVWNRLFNLPAAVLRRFQAGDLAERANGVKAVKSWLSSTIVTTVLTGLFAVSNFVLLFVYHPGMALLALVLTAGLVFMNLWLGIRSQTYQRQVVALQGRITSFVLLILEGVSKIQVANAAKEAMAQWRKDVIIQRRLMIRSYAVRNGLITFNGAYVILSALVIFYGAYAYADLDAGGFLAFNVAFTQIITTLLIWCRTIIASLGVLPYYERMKPLLAAVPETDRRRAVVPNFQGRIQIEHVWFRHRDDGDWLLRDASMTITPGAMVAIVGKVGSGKSTLLRLLLGFESPERGAIHYDGVSLAELDLQLLRRQLGVVLQNAYLPAGTIFRTIAHVQPLSPDDVWRACRLVGIASEIEQMPMQLDTYVSEGGTNLSGGQVQRLLLARALAHHPRILLLDEATSALNDSLQDEIFANFRAAGVTCIFVAHRMETVRYADVIYRLKDGTLSQIGIDDLASSEDQDDSTKIHERKGVNGPRSPLLRKANRRQS